VLIKNRQGLGIIAIFLVFLFLRLYQLGAHDFWYDEMISISYAKNPWHNWNAPLYWIVLHFWSGAFGFSEFSLRFPSLLFNFLAVIVVYFFGKELFNKRIGLVAAILMGLSPFHLWYAQEARDYSMVLFLSSVSAWMFYKSLKYPCLRWWLAFIVSSVLAIYTNYFYIFLLIAQVFIFLFFRKLKFNFDIKEVIAFLLIVLCFAPYLPRFWSKFIFIWKGFWLPQPNWNSLIITAENFILGYNLFPILYFILDGAVLILLIFAYRGLRQDEIRPSLLFCSFLFFIPIIYAFIFSKLLFSVYLDRALIIFSPYFYLILATGFASMAKNWLRFSLIGVFSVLILIALLGFYQDWMFTPYEHHMGTFLKKPFKPITSFIEGNLKVGDIVAVTNKNPPVVPSLKFYSRKLQNFYYFYDAGTSGAIDSNWRRPVKESDYDIPTTKINKIPFRRLWLLSADGGWRSGNLDDNSLAVKTWCDQNLRLKEVRIFDGLWLFKYDR